jgi:hypothetical protein
VLMGWLAPRTLARKVITRLHHLCRRIALHTNHKSPVLAR